jgi:hypothetical protein
LGSPLLVSTLARVVVRASRSRTNTSSKPLPSPRTRSLAGDAKTTWRPSALIRACRVLASGSPPAVSTVTRVVVPPCRSRTKMSSIELPSPATRSVALEANAT